MKRTTLSKFVGAGVISMSLAMGTLAMPSYAQTGTGTTPGVDPVTPVVVDTDREGDRDFDWGWLGLLGLLGLAGLAKKSHSEPTRYREPGEVGTGTGTRY